jgi:hypothetical protein
MGNVSQPAMVVCARQSQDSWDVLVKWQGHPATDATWEPLQQFKEEYPDFQLGDELLRRQGGSVVDFFFGKQYNRRKKKPTSVEELISG